MTLGYILAGLAALEIITAALIWLDRRQQRRANLEAAVEVERWCPLVAVDDPTPDEQEALAEGLAIVGELEPAQPITGDTLVLVGPGFVHRRCRDARRDGGKPCVDCYRVFVGVS